MTLIHKLFQYGFLLSVLSIVACGESEDTNTDLSSQAQITHDNARSFSIVGANATQIKQSDSNINSAANLLGFFFPQSSTSNSQSISIAISVSPVAALVAQFDLVKCGGSYAVTDNSVGQSINISVAFTDLCVKSQGIGPQITLNGSMTITSSGTNMIISFTDLLVSATSFEQSMTCLVTLNMLTKGVVTEDCTITDTTAAESKAEKISVSGSSIDGYMFEGEIRNNGEYVELSTITPIFFDPAICPDGQPIAGLVEIEGSNNSVATVDFGDGDNDCTTAELCVYTDAVDKGVCTTETLF